MLKAAELAGADVITLCDTNGGSLTNEISNIVEKVMETIRIPIGIHTHNDGGLGVANTLAAVQMGVSHVQGTINGVGERCGNANLCSIIPNLVLKMGLETNQKVDLSRLTYISHYVAELMNLAPDNRAPFVGKSAFAHKGGIHVSAVMKDSSMYEHISPKIVGSEQRVLVSDLSGKSNIRYKIEELDDNLMADEDLIARVVKRAVS